MRRSVARMSLTASAGLAALLLSSCAGSAGAGAPSSSSGAIEVVTSTNVYGDVVKAIGGDKVNVNAIITALAGTGVLLHPETKSMATAPKMSAVCLSMEGNLSSRMNWVA